MSENSVTSEKEGAVLRSAMPSARITPRAVVTEVEPAQSSRRQDRQKKKVEPPKTTEPPKDVVPKEPRKPWTETLPEWLRKDKPEIGLSDAKVFLWMSWWVYSRTGLYKRKFVRVPRFVNYEAKIADNKRTMKSHRSESMATGCVISSSGGVGKTTTSAGLSVSLIDATGVNVISYDGDISDPNLLDWFELPYVNDVSQKEVITGHKLIERLEKDDWHPTYEDLIPITAIDSVSNLMLIHAEEGPAISSESSQLLVQRIKPATHTFIADTEPGKNDSRQGTIGLVDASDIVVIAGDAQQPKSFGAIERTINEELFNLRTENGEAPRVIVCIGAVKPKDFNSRTRYEYAERFGVSPDRVVLVPFSNYIRGNQRTKKMNKFKLSALSAQVRYGYSELARIWSQMAVERNRSISNLTSNPGGSLQQSTQHNADQPMEGENNE